MRRARELGRRLRSFVYESTLRVYCLPHRRDGTDMLCAIVHASTALSRHRMLLNACPPSA
jgi:hypothetical protein